jgi:hypothetical protein
MTTVVIMLAVVMAVVMAAVAVAAVKVDNGTLKSDLVVTGSSLIAFYYACLAT